MLVPIGAILAGVVLYEIFTKKPSLPATPAKPPTAGKTNVSPSYTQSAGIPKTTAGAAGSGDITVNANVSPEQQTGGPSTETGLTNSEIE